MAQPGVNFKDITPLLQDAASFRQMIDELATPYQRQKIDVVVAIDARGFYWRPVVTNWARAVWCAKGKLPYKPLANPMIWNTAVMWWKCTKTLSFGPESFKLMMCFGTGGNYDGGLVKMVQNGGEIFGISFLIGLSFLNGKES